MRDKRFLDWFAELAERAKNQGIQLERLDDKERRLYLK